MRWQRTPPSQGRLPSRFSSILPSYLFETWLLKIAGMISTGCDRVWSMHLHVQNSAAVVGEEHFVNEVGKTNDVPAGDGSGINGNQMQEMTGDDDRIVIG